MERSSEAKPVTTDWADPKIPISQFPAGLLGKARMWFGKWGEREQCGTNQWNYFQKQKKHTDDGQQRKQLTNYSISTITTQIAYYKKRLILCKKSFGQNWPKSGPLTLPQENNMSRFQPRQTEPSGGTQHCHPNLPSGVNHLIFSDKMVPSTNDLSIPQTPVSLQVQVTTMICGKNKIWANCWTFCLF